MAVDFHDPSQVELYDSRQGTETEEESRLVRSLGISAEDVVIEYGPGTGAFLQATAAVCKFVYAVEVSAAMIVYARQRLGRLGLTNVAFHHQGFLTYEHKGAPAGFVVTKFALHHLPDFWKMAALLKINRFLKMGGFFFLEDVVFSFAPEFSEREIQRWVDGASGSRTTFSKADFEGHLRDEYSTYSWILEPIIQRAGFAIRRSEIRSPTIAIYLCEKVR